MTDIEKLVGIEREIMKKEKELTEYEDKAKINHILHLILSIVTGGIWLIVWALIGMSASSYKPKIKKVDEQLIQLYGLKKEAEYKLNTRQ